MQITSQHTILSAHSSRLACDSWTCSPLSSRKQYEWPLTLHRHRSCRRRRCHSLRCLVSSSSPPPGDVSIGGECLADTWFWLSSSCTDKAQDSRDSQGSTASREGSRGCIVLDWAGTGVNGLRLERSRFVESQPLYKVNLIGWHHI